MQDRIEINGVWYIKEDLANNQEVEDIELSFYQADELDVPRVF